jgi:hypothetical protein
MNKKFIILFMKNMEMFQYQSIRENIKKQNWDARLN